MNSQQIIELLKRQSNRITGNIIKDLIKEHSTIRENTLRLYNAYKGSVPIKERVFTDANKLNNKLGNDFRGDIVDTITGYLFGNPIVYKIDDQKYSGTTLEKLQAELNSFLARNNVDDLDSQTGKYASICGHAARLCYIDRGGKEKIMSIPPWEVIFVSDATLDELQFALIYYDIDLIDQNGKAVKRTKVEWYDNTNVTFFISNQNGDYELDLTNPRNPMPHMFDYIPVIKYINDDTLQGDFEKVESLIDAYDRALSDIQNEAEEFRIAYFAFYGVDITPEIITAARQTGAFGFPTKEASAEFITKDLDGAVTFLENHKNTLSTNIYKFAKSVDMRDEKFSGANESGESRKWKLVGLEFRAITKERKFTRATSEMFKIILSAWAKKNIVLNYEDIKLQFTRNLPVDLLYSSEVTKNFKGMISDETRLGLLPFVKDPIREKEKMQEEQAANPINLDASISADPGAQI